MLIVKLADVFYDLLYVWNCLFFFLVTNRIGDYFCSLFDDFKDHVFFREAEFVLKLYLLRIILFDSLRNSWNGVLNSSEPSGSINLPLVQKPVSNNHDATLAQLIGQSALTFSASLTFLICFRILDTLFFLLISARHTNYVKKHKNKSFNIHLFPYKQKQIIFSFNPVDLERVLWRQCPRSPVWFFLWTWRRIRRTAVPRNTDRTSSCTGHSSGCKFLSGSRAPTGNRRTKAELNKRRSGFFVPSPTWIRMPLLGVAGSFIFIYTCFVAIKTRSGWSVIDGSSGLVH